MLLDLGARPVLRRFERNRRSRGALLDVGFVLRNLVRLSFLPDVVQLDRPLEQLERIWILLVRLPPFLRQYPPPTVLDQPTGLDARDGAEADDLVEASDSVVVETGF